MTIKDYLLVRFVNRLANHSKYGNPKHQQPNTQKDPSVRVFYLKHENKMYREPQTRLRQAQTDSSCVCLSS